MNTYTMYILRRVNLILSIISVIGILFYIFYKIHNNIKLSKRYRNALKYVDKLYDAVYTIYYDKTGNEIIADMGKLELKYILEETSNDKIIKERLCDAIEAFENRYPRLFVDPISSNRELIMDLFSLIRAIGMDTSTVIEIG